MDMDTTLKLAGYDVLGRLPGDYPRQFVCRTMATAAGESDRRIILQVIDCAGIPLDRLEAVRAYGKRLAQLDHPGIARHLDSFEVSLDGGAAICVVREDVEGRTLRQLLEDSPQGLAWDVAKTIFSQCMDALMAAALNGCAHGYLHPACLTVSSDKTVKLHGFCHSLHDIVRSGALSNALLWNYVAPEYARTDVPCGDERSDLFSFGVCLFEALTGKMPFDIGSRDAFMAYWSREASTQPAFRAGVFRVLAQLKPFLGRLLDADRAARFATFSEAKQNFDSITPKILESDAIHSYELVEFIGRGGFGEVYKARRRHDGAYVAVKYLTMQGGANRFRREAEILRQNPHPNLVAYEGFFEASRASGEREYFLVLEFLSGMPGWSLRDRIRLAPGGLEPEEALLLFSSFLKALRHLHQNGIVHRDIKPGNLYAPSDNPARAKVFDLGVARSLSGTQTVGMVPGTWDYMPPEFFEGDGERGSPRSDIYALGLCLFEALTGGPAFPRLSRSQKEAIAELGRRMRGERAIDCEQPIFTQYPRLGALVRTSTQRDPAERFDDAAAMLDALSGCLEATRQAKAAEIARRADSGNEDEDVSADPGPEVRAELTVVTTPVEVLPTPMMGRAIAAVPPARKTGKRVSWGWVVGACLVAVGLVAGAVYMSNGSRAEQRGSIESARGAISNAPGPSGESVRENTQGRSRLSDMPDSTSNLTATVSPDKDFADFVGRIEGRVPGRFGGEPQDLAVLETLAGEIAGMGKANWPDVNEESLNGARKRLLEALARPILGHLLAVEKISAQDDSTKERLEKLRDQLLVTRDRLPQVEDICAKSFDRAMAALTSASGRLEFRSALDTLRREVNASGGDYNIRLAAWQAAAVRINELMGQAWPGLSEDEKRAQIEGVRKELDRSVTGWIAGLGQAGEAAILSGSGEREWERRLQGFKVQWPTLWGLYSNDYARTTASLGRLLEGRKSFEARLQQILARIEGQGGEGQTVEGIERALVEIGGLVGSTWPGVSKDEQRQRSEKLREQARVKLAVAVVSLREAGLHDTDAGKTGTDARDKLVAIRDRMPNAAGLVPDELAQALKAIEAAAKEGSARASLLAALKDGSGQAAVDGLPDGHREQAIKALGAAAGVRGGLDVSGLPTADRANARFVAQVAALWESATLLAAPYGPRVLDGAWDLIHAQLVAAVRRTLEGDILKSSPVQQAKARRRFLDILRQVDVQTRRVRACQPDDSLRRQVELYLKPPHYHRDIFDNSVSGGDDLSHIPWLDADLGKGGATAPAVEP